MIKMAITNIISAIGNNNSIYPLLVRDCGIEVPTKVYLTYEQNKKDEEIAMLATRERLVDEYTTSAVWLGGIPLLEKINNAIIRKNGFNPEISTQLLKGNKLEENIKKFKDKAPDAVKDLEFLRDNKKKYMGLLAGKIASELAIPIALMGFVIPKLIFAWTANTKKILAKQKREERTETMDKFVGKAQNLAFKGSVVAGIAQMSTVQKMAMTDGGYAVGRVVTARNKNAAYDVGFKMAGMLFLNFVFPKWLAKGLDKLTGQTSLDIKMFEDKEFISAVKNKTINTPNGDNLLEYIDKNPDSTFSKLAKRYRRVTILDNGVRDPRKFVDLDKLTLFRDNIAEVSDKALKSGNVDKFMKKAKFMKGANILANVGISSFLLAFGLPKAQFAFRKIITGSEYEPGILD